MRFARRLTIIISLCFVILGIVLMTCAAGLAGFKIEKLFNDDRKMNIIELNEKFDSVEVKTGIDSVKFVPSEGTASTIELYDGEKSYYDVRVEDSTLKIKYNENRKWYEFINFGSFSSHDVVVMIPAGSYKSIIVNTGIGDIEIPDSFTADSISTETGIGNIRAPKAGKTTNIHSGIGDIMVPDSETSGKVDIHTGIGDITVSRSETSSKPEAGRITSEPAASETEIPSKPEASKTTSEPAVSGTETQSKPEASKTTSEPAVSGTETQSKPEASRGSGTVNRR